MCTKARPFAEILTQCPSEPQLHYKAPNPNTLRLTRTNQVEDDFDEAETGGPAAAPPEVKPEAGAEAAPAKKKAKKEKARKVVADDDDDDDGLAL